MARKTHLKVRIVQEFDMSKEGYKHWSPRLRAKVHKKVFKSVHYDLVPVERLKNKDEIGRYCAENLWKGVFYLFGYSHGKTRTHVKLVNLCRINLKMDEDGKYQARVTHGKYARLSRYWFWVG